MKTIQIFEALKEAFEDEVSVDCSVNFDNTDEDILGKAEFFSRVAGILGLTKDEINEINENNA